MRIAVHGVLGDGVGSGAGSFPILLAALLERGHRVELFANPNYIKPRSLERFSGYRFRPLRVEAIERLWTLTHRFGSTYSSTVGAQASHIAYDRAARVLIDELDREERFDLILCTDAQALWPARVPTMSWPQSPPHTEAAALRDSATAKAVIERRGVAHFAAVQSYYAYRALLARASLGSSQLLLVASHWARDEWVRFGADPARLRVLPYPFELDAFAGTGHVGQNEKPTLLWLGRATPRKRLDLFLEAFALVRARNPNVAARLVGNLRDDPFAATILERHAGQPGLSVEGPRPRQEVPSLLAEVDLLVQTSQNENFGFSLAEALAAGRVVVAGPTNGTLEYAGAAGFGFTEYTAESVAQAIGRALEAARTQGTELSEQARAAAAKLATGVVVEHFLAVCAELAARPRR